MNKPYAINKLSDSKDISLLNNLFTILFNNSQDKEFLYKSFDVTATWITTDDIKEKQFLLVENIVDNEVRLYTKINGNLKYLVFT